MKLERTVHKDTLKRVTDEEIFRDLILKLVSELPSENLNKIFKFTNIKKMNASEERIYYEADKKSVKKRLKCYYCGKFLSRKTTKFNPEISELEPLHSWSEPKYAHKKCEGTHLERTQERAKIVSIIEDKYHKKIKRNFFGSFCIAVIILALLLLILS